MQFNFNTVKEFYTENITDEVLRKAGLTAGIFTVVIVSQLILHGFVEIVDSIPVFNSLMQVVGVYATVRFVLANITTQEKRDNLVENVRNTYQDVVG
jgi:4-amino-4-deoxy-L-arabinose transferase-like glycosyltransferase